MGLYIGVLSHQVARVSAGLPAAGAWDIAMPELVCAGAEQVTLHLGYTRGAAGGAFDWQVAVSPYSIAALVPAGGAEWTTLALYEAGAVVAGADTQSNVQREYQNYASTAAAQEAWVYGPIGLAGSIERLRVRARETGVVGTPGILQITAVFS